jgi:diadenosine tetraphosphate (Ap4A) HIT family hydrolase
MIQDWESLFLRTVLISLVNEVQRLLDERLRPKPDSYNVGFNSGVAAGQTIPHVHIHVIPRYHGDVPDPTGGVRHVIADKAKSPTWLGRKPSSNPIWKRSSARASSISCALARL